MFDSQNFINWWIDFTQRATNLWATLDATVFKVPGLPGQDDMRVTLLGLLTVGMAVTLITIRIVKLFDPFS
ncbi:MAG: hypothetical protein MJZ37_09980 [Bacilli bacterium]|nr:hypothetical protein [Bacilli bacterium]